MRPVFDPYLLTRISAEVLALNQARPEELLRCQQQRLAQLLAAARAGSAFYRERLSGLPDDASALPRIAATTRSELSARFSDWVCDPRLEWEELQAFTADAARIGQPYLGQYVVWESSGSSGVPGIFVQNARAMAVYDALEALRRSDDSALRRWFDPWCLSERLAFVGATSGHFASFVTLQRLRELQPWLAGALQSFSILQPIEALVAQLNAFSPTVLVTYPTAALVLAEQAAKGCLRVQPRELWSGGETLGLAARRLIEQHLRCRVRNNYGASEFLAMGWECAAGQMHLNADWVLLEPVDERGRPVPAGQPSHSVLLTNLANWVQPLIRCDLGDQITLHEQPCACGSPLPVFEVQGRSDDILRVRGHGGVAVALLPLALTTVLEDDAGVFDFQLRQQNQTTLVLRLPQTGAWAQHALERGRQVLQGFALRQGALPIDVLGELGQAIPLGRSGKVTRIVAQSSTVVVGANGLA